jgi:hypothetical protein
MFEKAKNKEAEYKTITQVNASREIYKLHKEYCDPRLLKTITLV